MFLLLIPPLLFIYVGVIMTLGHITARAIIKGYGSDFSGAWIICSFGWFLLSLLLL